MVSREIRERIIKNLSDLKRQSEDIYKRALTLVDKGEIVVKEALNGSDLLEKRAAVFLVVAFSAATGEMTTGDETGMTKNFANGLLQCVKTSSDEVLVKLASRALFYLIQTSKAYAIEIAEMVMKECKDWMDEKQKPTEQERTMTLILMRDCALFTSQYFFRKAPGYFNYIFKFIREYKSCRTIARMSLHAALTVISQREHRQKNEWYKKCVDEAKADGSLKEDNLYASLLIYNEIMRIGYSKTEKLRLRLTKDDNFQPKRIADCNPVIWLMEETRPPVVESHTAQSMVSQNLDDISRVVSEARTYYKGKLQDLLLEIYPRLIAYSKLNNKPINLEGLLPTLKEMALKHSQVYQCLGLICLQEPADTAFLFSEKIGIMPAIIQHLSNIKPKGLKPADEPVLKFLCCAIESHSELIGHHVKEVLPKLFNIGFVDGVIEVLHHIVKYLPGLTTDVHDGLLELLWRQLMDQPRPHKLAPPTKPPVPLLNSIKALNDVPTMVLALKTLGDFDFSRHDLQMFINYLAEGYVHCDQIEVRLAAVECCAKIVQPFIRIYERTESVQKRDVFMLIRNILESLIKLAVVDREVEVRLCVVKTFACKDAEFLSHLAHPDLLDILSMTIHDENPAVQEASVGLVGAMTELNPAYVIAKLRKLILETIAQLSTSKSSHLEEQSAKCIAVLAQTSPKFVMPYMDSILKALEPHLEKRTIGVTLHVLNALSRLAPLGGVDMVAHYKNIFKPLLQHLQDATSLYRREAALRTMGGLCQSVAYVVAPYKDYPELMDLLLKLLKTELNANMRRLTIKTLGIIGALDPYTHKVFLGTVSSARSSFLAVSLPTSPESDDPRLDIIRWINYERCTLPQFYPAITIATLLEMMQDESLTLLHKQIVEALFKIFSELPKANLHQYVDQVLPKLLILTEKTNPEFRQFYLDQLKKLAPFFQMGMKPYLRDVFKLIEGTWQDHPHLRGHVIRLLSAIGKALGSDFDSYVTDLCPYLLSVVQLDNTKDRQLTKEALECVASINSCLAPHLHLIVPPLIEVIDGVENRIPDSVRSTALDTLLQILSSHSIGERAPSVMQMWLRNMHHKPFQDRLMKVLLAIVDQMWEQFVVYCDAVKIILVKHRIPDQQIRRYYDRLKVFCPSKSESLLAAFHSLSADERKDVPQQYPTPSFSPTSSKRIPVNVKDYMTMTEIIQEDRRALMVPQRSDSIKTDAKNFDPKKLTEIWKSPVNSHVREDWISWLDALRIEFLKCSPAVSLNCCGTLAEAHPQLAKELFNASFMSVWTELNCEDQQRIARKFSECLKCGYGEVIQMILNLAEFMAHSEKGPLPVNHPMLSESAAQVQAYAKALRYKELEMWSRAVDGLENDLSHTRPGPNDCQQLITFAKKLNLEELALGVITHAKRLKMEVSGRWQEKLGQWEKALECYDKEIVTVTNPEELLAFKLRLMRCHEQLGDWREVNMLADELLEMKNLDNYSGNRDLVDRKQRILQIAARGAWTTGDFKKMSQISQQLNENTVEGSFLRAVVAVKEENFDIALTYINKVRDTFDSELTAMAAESYERAYGPMMMAQHLTELEEAIEYKMVPERRMRIAICWSRRLQGISLDVEQWHKTLIIRQIVLSQDELRPMWIKFAGLCRKKGRPNVASRVLLNLLGIKDENTRLIDTALPLDKLDKTPLALAICKQLWHENHKQAAIEKLEVLNAVLSKVLDGEQFKDGLPKPLSRVAAKCYLKLADWQSSFGSGRGMNSGNQSPLPSRHPSVSSRINTPTGLNRQYWRQRDEPTGQILNYYLKATELHNTWYKAWQRLAILYYNLVMNQTRNQPVETVVPQAEFQPISEYGSNFDLQPLRSPDHVSPSQIDVDDGEAPRNFIVPPEAWNEPCGGPDMKNTYEMQGPASPNQSIFVPTNLIGVYAVEAVKCYLHAIHLAEGSRMEDTLRLLMLLIEHGKKPEVDCSAIKMNLRRVAPETWLEVAPQLISRLDRDDNVGILFKQILIDVAKVHPQGLIYALLAARKSKSFKRSDAAGDILNALKEADKQLVEEGEMLNEELIRCAILWHEMWHEALEDASRLYFSTDNNDKTGKNVDDMVNVLRPLHQKIELGHVTFKELSFIQNYYKDLKDAYDYCNIYQKTKSQKDITQAWDLYYNVFKKISVQLRQLNSLDLNYVSPKLAKAKNLKLCVPGTYDPNGRLIKITSIDHTLQVILSKQRPRKLVIRGDDGNEYIFLLKGHEDPRQDERVMQLFGLINSLILKDPDTCRRDLTIQRYAIIGLSQSSGLIGWVPNCDTLHALITDYRKKKQIPISLEHGEMQKMCNDYEKLTLMQKVDVFRSALRMTQGNDLRETLWMKSPTSEVWFDRRTNFTRSMACMSMVGYILGLGDRHPSNIMLDRLSGKIVHIDFGDCFEVAMRREKYPEKVPFRLTRMLIHAMEVTGLEGNYRITCERILRLIRQNRYSILAVLEAFVYDPVLNWFKIPDAINPRRDNDQSMPPMPDYMDQQVRQRSQEALDRVRTKLNGLDFLPGTVGDIRVQEMDIQTHVDRLIEQATLAENLCQCYIGWCPFW